MNIYVIGNGHQLAEIKKKISGDHNILPVNDIQAINDTANSVVFDFTISDSPDDLEKYAASPNLTLFINSTHISLAELTFYSEAKLPNIFGMAADPTYLERPLLEVCALSSNKVNPDSLFGSLGLDATLVDDRVGLVTPRIISMIINEAYYTVMEGTATKDDVDTAMKFGTNYPLGPFEWAKNWGIANVFELLEALYLDTKDVRYKICPLLKQEYLILA